jgi:hypothetical protein
MIEIAIRGGLVAYISPEDVERVQRYTWRRFQSHGNIYAVAYIPEDWALYRRRETFMHRLIMNAKPGQQIDHKDGNGLNNTRDNLRIASHTLNMQNSKSRSGSTSRYKGVSWNTQRGKWVAQIRYDGRTRFLGYYTYEDEAARVYDEAALIGHGESARLNFPRGIKPRANK